MSLQKISFNQDHAKCVSCGKDISDLNNFKYAGETISEPTYWEERCVCTGCGTEFIIHYDIFDKHGHILSRTFSEDVNDTKYNWQDNLTKNQKEVIEAHLINCSICRNRPDKEMLLNAWFSSLIHGGKK